MKIYFDESYPSSKEKIILGALFLSDSAHRYLHKKFKKIKENYGIKGEIKYSTLYSNKYLKIAKEIIQKYFNTTYPYFRSCILPYTATGLAKIPGTNLNQKRIGIYVDSAKKLILGNLPAVYNTEVYVDEETRIAKTKFYLRLEKAKAPSGGKIKLVKPVKSEMESNHLIQVCDLLTGAIKQNLYPTNTKKGRFKKQFGGFVKSLSGAPNFRNSYWARVRKSTNKKRRHNKLLISYWSVPNFRKYRRN